MNQENRFQVKVETLTKFWDQLPSEIQAHIFFILKDELSFSGKDRPSSAALLSGLLGTVSEKRFTYEKAAYDDYIQLPYAVIFQIAQLLGPHKTIADREVVVRQAHRLNESKNSDIYCHLENLSTYFFIAHATVNRPRVDKKCPETPKKRDRRLAKTLEDRRLAHKRKALKTWNNEQKTKRKKRSSLLK